MYLSESEFSSCSSLLRFRAGAVVGPCQHKQLLVFWKNLQVEQQYARPYPTTGGFDFQMPTCGSRWKQTSLAEANFHSYKTHLPSKPAGFGTNL